MRQTSRRINRLNRKICHKMEQVWKYKPASKGQVFMPPCACASFAAAGFPSPTCGVLFAIPFWDKRLIPCNDCLAGVFMYVNTQHVWTK